MKLSEAIRLGSMLGPQVRGRLGNATDGTCAIGAAAVAGVPTETRISDGTIIIGEPRYGVGRGPRISRVPKGESYEAVAEHIAVIFRHETDCPAGCGLNGEQVFTLIPHLNDDHEWTRERIADFVATIEDAQTVVAQPESAQVAK
jgi:hypothetical protein